MDKLQGDERCEECANALDQLFRQRHTHRDVLAEVRSLWRAAYTAGRAAIPREPTAEMVNAAYCCTEAGFPALWRAMYDAAMEMP